jgi:hypothetical protein
MVIGVPICNPPEESENEGANNNRNSLFKDHWSTGQNSNGYIDMDYGFPTPPAAGSDYWEFRSGDGRILKRIQLPSGLDAVYANYTTSNSVGTLYVRNGLGPNQIDMMFNGTTNLVRKSDASFKGLMNKQGGEAYMVRGKNTAINNGTIADSGWDNRELPLIEIFEVNNTNNATSFSMAAAFSETTARDADGDGLANTNEWLVGTDVFDTDSDNDGLPDGWEVAYSLNPTNGTDGASDFDMDSFLAWQEFITGTHPGNSNSFFEVISGLPLDNHSLIEHLAESGRLYQVYFADETAGAGWIWQAFANTNIPFGRYLHNSAPGLHTFTDDYSAATSGSMPTNGLRVYRIGVEKP